MAERPLEDDRRETIQGIQDAVNLLTSGNPSSTMLSERGDRLAIHHAAVREILKMTSGGVAELSPPHADGAALSRKAVRGGGADQGKIRRVPLGEGVLGGDKRMDSTGRRDITGRRDNTGKRASTGRRDSTGKRVAGAAVLKMELLGGEGEDSNMNKTNTKLLTLSPLCRRSQAWQ